MAWKSIASFLERGRKTERARLKESELLILRIGTYLETCCG